MELINVAFIGAVALLGVLGTYIVVSRKKSQKPEESEEAKAAKI
jgi:hypothetical protein